FFYFVERSGIAMKQKLQELKEEASQRIAEVNNLRDLQELRVKYLGKKGEIKTLLRGMGKLPPAERPVIGSLANEIQKALEEQIDKKETMIEKELLEQRLIREKLDVTLPGRPLPIGAI